MCITIPAEVQEVCGAAAVVDFGSVTRQVMICAPDVHVGSWVLVHAGIIVGTISESDALESRRLIGELKNQPLCHPEDR
jgi:hydrogenase expression/formation protein HypC